VALVASLHLVRPLPAKNVCALRHRRYVLRKVRTTTMYIAKCR
jgi:hypothetical protein